MSNDKRKKQISSFEDLSQQYIEELKRKKYCQKNIDINESVIRCQLSFWFNKYSLSEISSDVVKKFQEDFLSKNYRYRYRCHVFSSLSCLLRFGKQKRVISEDVKVESVCYSVLERTQFWTENDYQVFISSFQNQKYVVFFSLLFRCGLSAAETRGLKKEDFDFIKRIVNVRRGFIRKKKKSNKELLVERKTQTYELTDDISELVREYVNSITTDFLFSISRFEVSDKLYSTCKKLGIRRIILHGNHNKNLKYIINNTLVSLY